MANTLTITDGTDSVSLLAASGFNVLNNGYEHQPAIANFLSSGSESGGPAFLPTEGVIESIRCKLIGSSHDNLASQLITLGRLLRAAGDYKKRIGGRTKPVYLQAQYGDETGARYSKLSWAGYRLDAPLYSSITRRGNVISDITIVISREACWRSGAPAVLPTVMTQTAVDGPASPTRSHIANFRDDVDITHLYNYDASLTTFSANQVSATGITLFKVGANATAVNDGVYIGSTEGPWHNVVIPIATAGVFDWVVKVYLVNGGGAPAYVELTAGTQYTLYPTGPVSSIFTSAGDWVLNVAPPSTWALATINAVSAWWIFVKITTFTSTTTQPLSHGTNTPYFASNRHLIIPSGGTAGDHDPIILLRAYAPYGATTTPCMGACSRVLIGAKQNVPAGFEGWLNLGNSDNPAAWATAYGTDASASTGQDVPGGNMCAVTFATQSTLGVRVTLTGDDLLDDYAGKYRVFLLAQQIGGAVGDIRLKVRTCIGSTADGDPKLDTPQVGTKLESHDLGYEILDLTGEDVLTLPFSETSTNDSMVADLIFQIMAERLTGTATLKLAALVLLPIDLSPTSINDPRRNTTLGSSALRGDTIIDLDGGVLDWRCLKYRKVGSNLVPSETWESGPPIMIRPATATQLYFLQGHYPSTWTDGPLIASLGMHLAIELYAHSTYNLLRGSG